MSRRHARAGFALFVVCALGVWIGLRVLGGKSPRPASLILITLDTTRADRLPPYDGGIRLPAIEQLARDGVVFDQAIAPVPLTLPSHSSIFSGLVPPGHRVRVNAAVLDAKPAVFPERLRAAGYRTAAFVGSVVLDRERGLGRGFDVYGDVNTGVGSRRLRRPANEVIDAALEWLAAGDDSPFFLWVHLFDAHAPYSLPAQFDTTTGDAYGNALAFMDSEIARLLRAVDSRRALEPPAIVVTADHGESLGEHGENSHGIFVYESAIRVPLIVRWPGATPRRVPDLVQLVDIAPTVLELEGVAAPPMDGVSLAPFLRGGRSAGRLGYAESMFPLQHAWSALRSVRDDKFKFIEAPRPELYRSRDRSARASESLRRPASCGAKAARPAPHVRTAR